MYWQLHGSIDGAFSTLCSGLLYKKDQKKALLLDFSLLTRWNKRDVWLRNYLLGL